ncbi:hypothetical protein TREMEDRAFT_30214 [Tremella mesenterica DSM 1558]|uniref:uncharacterized protein n=1 Tax=Tremella mesenterica (strain ATCC 24925 / CBS 8224 / DSM 1558 / NBRC 9311 / NRRL Y-6157 / RJB 2259-6 / UBC 559-6) TaxID=578456 RepID=UPI0003F48D63|nr:uncharacterized protein TREMEDRAFT_30214 [Tremella mesenterica DSM 1558]EIW69824.1 hypothetical protein TREMEDRAFT_30214 [Tremella mesenterica DSM 1558]
MSRALPSPPLSSLPLTHITAMANDLDPPTDRSPKDWFERARHEADLAVIAERKGRKEEMFLAYTRAAACYTHARLHPDYSKVKSEDSSWAQRIKDFKPTYDAFVSKAKEIKEILKQRPVERGERSVFTLEPRNTKLMESSTNGLHPPPPPQRQPSGPDIATGGSIADRMRALNMKGMDVGSSTKRLSVSKDREHTIPSPTKPGGSGGMLVTGGAGRNRSGSTSAQSTQPSVQTATTQRRPSVHLKPNLSPPKQNTGSEESVGVRETRTGSSTRSKTSTGPDSINTHLSETNHSDSNHIHTQLSSSPHRLTLPTIPQAPDQVVAPFEYDERQHTPQTETPTKIGPDGIEEFEKNFPSLSKFDQEFDVMESTSIPEAPISGLPLSPSSHIPTIDLIGSPNDEATSTPTFPDVPTFPSLPSVPSHRPGLPPPPSRPDNLNFDSKGPRPPSPAARHDFIRPASTPNVSEMEDNLIPPHNPVSPSETRKRLPLPLPPIRSPLSNGGPMDAPSPPLSFPVAKATLEKPTKPKFPFANCIDPDTLRSYFLNPAVDVVLLDVRSEEEFRRGYVGKEYEPRGAIVKAVWMDPTVLLRSDMTSNKLEDSLSLSPEAQRKAFEERHKADLVVVYDSNSVSWPRKGSPPTALSRLWDIIYEHEFAKKLERTPVMLTGGYHAWTEFIKMRAARHMNGVNGSRHGVAKGVNGSSSSRPSISNGDAATKRANREMPVYQSSQYAKNISESFGYANIPQSMIGETSYTGHPSSSRYPIPSPVRSPHSSAYSSTPIAPPPQATLHPGPGARRKSDYVEQHNQPYSGYTQSRNSFDYPQTHSLPQPPPPVQTHSLERYDPRPSVVRSGSIRGLDLVARETGDVKYWDDVSLGLTGLKNLGATCYMNSTIQCLSATYPFARLFLDGGYKKMVNVSNPLGTKGVLAKAFGDLLHALWEEQYHFLTPKTFRASITAFAPQFTATNEQHDSQEFLSFVLDGLHEDLNRVLVKPPPVEMTPEREHALETLSPEVASEKEWQIYRMRDDSFIVDLFQGQYRNRLECLTCGKTSTTYDAFMYMSLQIPRGKNKLVVQELIDEFVETEIIDKDDAWYCPRCKVPRRASKTLTIARLPPVLLIQLKRFSTKDGLFWDKSDAHIVFPLKNLDLSRYVPPRMSTGREDLGDPRTQVAPFKYDCYAVSNHIGTLSSGHYTAYVKSSKGWMFCEDSRITHAQEKDIVVSDCS